MEFKLTIVVSYFNLKQGKVPRGGILCREPHRGILLKPRMSITTTQNVLRVTTLKLSTENLVQVTDHYVKPVLGLIERANSPQPLVGVNTSSHQGPFNSLS